MYKCGFEGTYAEAEAHELICSKKDAAPADDDLFDDSDDSSEEAAEVVSLSL